jgi:hypothetical protein
MLKPLLILIAVLVALLGTSSMLLRASYKAQGLLAAEKASFAAAVTSLQGSVERSRKVSALRVTEARVARAEAQAARSALDNALRVQPQWAETPVPKEVLDALH